MEGQIEVTPPTENTVSPTLPDSVSESDVRAAIMSLEGNAPAAAEVPAQAAPAMPPVEVPAPAPVVSSVEVPSKFLKPDGTVDVEKLQTSTKRLDEAIEKKTLSIDEMVAKYKEKEATFHSLPSVPAQAQPAVQPVPAAQANPYASQPGVPQDMAALHSQIMADMQKDPIGTIADIVRIVAKEETKPVMEFVETQRSQQKDLIVKTQLAELAKADPRVTDPNIYAKVIEEIQSDPGYKNLKNPYKAAWNEVKERLRLGDVPNAQPGKIPTPILGGGTPPPVPSAMPTITPKVLESAISAASSKQEMAAVEAEVRRATQGMGWH